MEVLFTAAAQRALAEAAAWSAADEPPEEGGTRGVPATLETAAVLLGLLAESECRAAMMLARHGIDAAAVRSRWPGLGRNEARFPAWSGWEAADRRRGAGGGGREAKGFGSRESGIERDKPAATSDFQHPTPNPQPPIPIPSSTAPDHPTAQGGIPVHGFSAGFAASLAAARRRLFDYPRPLVLATEHILLGLADADHEVAVWLRGQGLDPDAIEVEIHQHYGHRRLGVSEEIGPPVDVPPDTGAGGGGSGVGDEQVDSAFAPCAPSPATRHPPPATPSPPPVPRPPPPSALRVIDAAGNRAREGLRVVEDYLRFVLDDRFLFGQVKDLRHDLAAVLARFPLGQRLAARETRADVGTAITTGGERLREETGQVLAANFTRLQEALRSLEEFTKLLDADASAQLKQLRYRSYTLQRAVEITRSSASRLAAARLYVLLDGRASLDELAALARSLVASGVNVLQLRDKRLDDRQLLERAAALREITRAAGVLFIMNDRPDLAVLAQADGVHVGQEDVSVKAARTIVGPDALVGVSTHSIDQARQAVLDGANYIGVGPTFPSQTKAFEQFPGLDLLRAVASEIRLPAFAIGGISPENNGEVLQTGIGRVAVSGAILDAADRAGIVRALRDRLLA